MNQLPPEHARLLARQRVESAGIIVGLVVFVAALVAAMVSPLPGTLNRLQASAFGGMHSRKLTGMGCVLAAALPAVVAGRLTTRRLRRPRQRS
jgi:hypothetical protein